MSDVDDVVTEDGFHPSTVVGAHLVFEETISKGLAVSFNLYRGTEDIGFELIEEEFECSKL